MTNSAGLSTPLRFAALPPQAEALRSRVQAFLTPHIGKLAPATRARSWMGFDADFSRALAAEGLVGLTLPVEFGGAGLDHFARFVVVEELLRAGAPVCAHWIADRQSGPLIHRYGTQAQKAFYLPRIARAEAFFCIGMSEPQAGSDLSAIRTRATRIDGSWRLDGQKLWTTYAHRAQYMIALVRTSGTAEDRHEGLSQFIVDLATPGITLRAIPDLAGDSHFNEVFLDNVVLPDDALIGEEGAGWAQVNAELAFERAGPERIYSSIMLLEAWLEHLRLHGAGASATRLAGRLAVELATLRALGVAITARLAAGESPLLEAALAKDSGTSFEQEMIHQIADEIETDAGADLMDTLEYLMQVAPTFSLRGGTREILRSMIARGLGLR
jgi:alkylation response protein AidB-like acyl-CoA dehydrogenase